MGARLFLTAMALTIPASALSAATQVQTFDLAESGFATAAPFDTNLGTLNSVQFSFSGNVTYGWSAEGEGTVDTNLFFAIDAELFGGDGSLVSFLHARRNGSVVEFMDPGDRRSGSEFLSVSGSDLYTDPATLGLFLASVGSPEFTYSFNMFDDRFYNDGPSFSGSFGPASGTASLIYDYTQNVVPEPASWAMMIAGFGLVGGALRRRPNGIPVTS